MDGRSPGKVRSLLLIAVLLFLGIFLWGLYRDLALDSEDPGTVPPDEKKSLVSVEEIEIRKDLSGDLWTLFSEKADQAQDMIRARNVEIQLDTIEGPLWRAESPLAEYSENKGVIKIYQVSGRTVADNYAFSWVASEALFLENTREWEFPSGLRVSGQKMILEGNAGRADPRGVIYLENGAIARWIFPE